MRRRPALDAEAPEAIAAANHVPTAWVAAPRPHKCLSRNSSKHTLVSKLDWFTFEAQEFTIHPGVACNLVTRNGLGNQRADRRRQLKAVTAATVRYVEPTHWCLANDRMHVGQVHRVESAIS